MPKFFPNAIGLLMALSLFACGGGFSKISINGDDYYVPKCESLVQFSAHSFTVKGIEVPISKEPYKIGEVVWKPEVLQKAGDIVQILELHRMATCQSLPAFASSGSRMKFAERLAQMQDDDTRIAQLALLLAANNPQAVSKFIEAYQGPAVALAPRAPTKGEMSMGGELPPPIVPRSLEGVAPTNPSTVMPIRSFLE